MRFLGRDGDHDRRTDEVIRRIQAKGVSWFGGTTWRGMRVMRVSLVNWACVRVLFDLPADKGLTIQKLSGNLKLGGRLVGKITGSKKSDGLDYSWDIVFDLALPAKAAAAGPSCGP